MRIHTQTCGHASDFSLFTEFKQIRPKHTHRSLDHLYLRCRRSILSSLVDAINNKQKDGHTPTHSYRHPFPSVCHPKGIRSNRPSCLFRVFRQYNQLYCANGFPSMIPFIQPETSLLCYGHSSQTGQLPIFPTSIFRVQTLVLGLLLLFTLLYIPIPSPSSSKPIPDER